MEVQEIKEVSVGTTGLVNALLKAAKQFRFYANEHYNKGSPEKAMVNGAHAQMCEQAVDKFVEELFDKTDPTGR